MKNGMASEERQANIWEWTPGGTSIIMISLLFLRIEMGWP